ncbi:CrcB family protein [Calidifontibacter sp. DB0510]|uniref:Fluoride-specific ion channel FluC n=1 Tax=Metallococcus carri TaxID=1656884 RepID=A0A967E926_9MICO|nr:CrcB family protein [Metallococcus carri]NHN54780.1 CrcB family protein [Metallococcus carri]NOP37125.1 CrcB family protein [Calidifontibacter sp. DB2511S]
MESIDPDIASSRGVHQDPALLGLVFVGGCAGTAIRAALEDAAPAHGGWPWATFLINLVGAFLLAALLEVLGRGPDVGIRRRIRLGVGTGLLGGFTTYSTFAVEITGLGVASAIGYAVATVCLGVLAAAAGALFARRLGERA